MDHGANQVYRTLRMANVDTHPLSRQPRDAVGDFITQRLVGMQVEDELEIQQPRCGLGFPSGGDSVDESFNLRICPFNANPG